MKALVLDLRGETRAGLLDQAVAVREKFVERKSDRIH